MPPTAYPEDLALLALLQSRRMCRIHCIKGTSFGADPIRCVWLIKKIGIGLHSRAASVKRLVGFDGNPA